jgi:hypothetical protein
MYVCALGENDIQCHFTKNKNENPKLLCSLSPMEKYDMNVEGILEKVVMVQLLH